MAKASVACSASDCNAPAKKRGLCGLHYSRWIKKTPLESRKPSHRRGICSIEGCEKKHYGKGWCNLHYQKWRKYADPLYSAFSGVREVEKFYQMAIAHNGQDCLLWPFGSKGKKNYGTFYIPGKRNFGIHRLICEARHGPPPSPAHHAAHSCGVRACCNPRHLRWATPAENQADRIAHDTHMRGTRSPNAKLTEDDVRSIRALIGTLPRTSIAEKFGVSDTTILYIERKRNWGWLE